MSSQETIYTGDILLAVLDETGDLDIQFVNGQPVMTNGLETISLLYVLGEDCWLNAIVDSNSGKMQSGFPEIIRRNSVSDDTKNDGTQAIKKALQPMLDEQIASKITVVGYILSVNGIGWEINIENENELVQYFINWENMQLTLQREAA